MHGPVMGTVATPTISFSAYSSSAANSSTVTLNKPTGTADGDLLIVFISSLSNTDLVTAEPSSGWVGDNYIGTGQTHVNYVSYKVASSEPSNWSWTMTSALIHPAVCILLKKSGGTWDPDQDYDEAAAANTETGITCPDMTATDNSIVVMNFVNDLYSRTVSSAPSGMTEIANFGGSGGGTHIATYYQAYNAGTVTGKAITWSAADDNSVIGLVIDLVP
jgi:hypothetical protein